MTSCKKKNHFFTEGELIFELFDITLKEIIANLIRVFDDPFIGIAIEFVVLISSYNSIPP